MRDYFPGPGLGNSHMMKMVHVNTELVVTEGEKQTDGRRRRDGMCISAVVCQRCGRHIEDVYLLAGGIRKK